MAARSAVVIGAGIGGLAAVTAVRAAGFEVRAYDAADELRPLGAGLSVWPNGVMALRALGLGDVADEAPRAGGALRRADGSVLAAFDPAVIASRYGAPLVGLNRTDLQTALLAAAEPGSVALGKRATGLEQGRVRFADGDEIAADLVVGADGLRSVIRGELRADGDPEDSGIVAFRGLSRPAGEMPAGEWWAADAVAGLLPLAGGLAYWYVAGRGAASAAQLSGWVDRFAAPMPEIVLATATEDVLCHRLYDRPPVERWGDGATTLLGDAAHPMLPFLGQGACSALEDAVALGEALRAHDDVPTALRAYEAARTRRTAGLVRGSRRAGSVALGGDGLRGRLRNAVLAHLPEPVRLRQLDRVIRG